MRLSIIVSNAIINTIEHTPRNNHVTINTKFHDHNISYSHFIVIRNICKQLNDFKTDIYLN